MNDNKIVSRRITCQVGEAEFSFETGKLARQADAAVVARLGDTVVLVTAVQSREAREGIDFFPLLVDYEERLYAAGKIKGSRWIKREGRATDEAILKGRVIDRSLRPLFLEGMRNDVQIIATVLSIDGQNEPDVLAVNAASMALHISKIPFGGPIAGVRVGKIDGQYVVNPTLELQAKSTMDLVVCGTEDHVMMVEAGAKLVTEEEIVEAIKFAQRFLGELCRVQEEFKKQIGKEKVEPIMVLPDEKIMAKVKELLTDNEIEAAVYVKDKEQREENINQLIKNITAKVKAAVGSPYLSADGKEVNVEAETNQAIDKILKTYQQQQILQKERRVDGRKLDETRPIVCEVGVLPRTHGSALFTRGETQGLTIVTLGSKGDEQTLDGMEDPTEGRVKRYIHHYNMPGYSTGEVAPVRGPGRREIGHGMLAERAVEVVLPPQETFPYTMRLVSEIMSSNGSTSMAATCGSTLALMDAGVPISHVIGGCAMGLVMDEESPENFKVLTDIAGIEDFNGHMDFKVTGDENGITALQLDVKVKGLTAAILEQALMQAKPARVYIIGKMKEALPAPRPDLSPFAPRITSFKIKPDKIREVIGSGGKTINEIIANCPGVKIDIEDDGLVMVTSVDAEMSKKAVEWIQNIVKEVQPGEVYEGKVMRLMDFGAFVEVLPGKEGLVHISQLANYHVGRVEDVVKVGDTLKVQVTDIDDQGRINLTHKPFASGASPDRSVGTDRGNNDSFRPRGPRSGGFSRGSGRGNSRGGRPPRRNFDR
jgi:polyribonucleotide nucleotidyltransferase